MNDDLVASKCPDCAHPTAVHSVDGCLVGYRAALADLEDPPGLGCPCRRSGFAALSRGGRDDQTTRPMPLPPPPAPPWFADPARRRARIMAVLAIAGVLGLALGFVIGTLLRGQ